MWERLPNVGRESHTYLHHIVANYDHLASVTVFTQGSISEHPKNVYNEIVRYVAEGQKYNVYYRTLTNWGKIAHIGKYKYDLEHGSLQQANTTLGEFWKILFGNPHPKKVTTSHSAGCVWNV